jgi:hypothetical protein
LPTISFIRAEIARMRIQALRQRKDILSLQHAGINSLPAEALLARMLTNIDNLCTQRDKIKKDSKPTLLGGRSW